MQSERPASGRSYAWLLALAVLVSVLLELPAFGADHFKGDELVYLGLSRVMGWDLSNYSVRDVPLVNEFPNALYRAPLCPHPPLYPLLLKLGVSGMLATGYLPSNFWPLLLFGFGFKLLALYAMHSLLTAVTRRPWSAPVGVLLLALCPLMSLTSGRLMLDAAFAALLLWSVVRILRALRTDRTVDWVIAGLAFALFMNTKYQALGFSPVPLLVVAATVPRIDRPWLRAHAGKLAAAAGVVLVFGGFHFARLLQTYGTLGVEPWMAVEREAGAFVTLVGQRTRLEVWLYLLLIYPFWLLWLSRSYWSRALGALRAREAAALPTLLALYAFGLTSVMMHTQLRYWTVFACFLIAACVVHADSGERTPRGVALLGGLALVSMASTSYLVNVMFPGQQAPDVLPAIVFFSPWPFGP